MNQSRVVDDKFWAEEMGELLEELTADVDGFCGTRLPLLVVLIGVLGWADNGAVDSGLLITGGCCC